VIAARALDLDPEALVAALDDQVDSASAAVRQKDACDSGCGSCSRLSTSSITNVSQLSPRTGRDSNCSPEEMVSTLQIRSAASNLQSQRSNAHTVGLPPDARLASRRLRSTGLRLLNIMALAAEDGTMRYSKRRLSN